MGVTDDPGGPVVPGTWVTSQKAVNAFEAFCLDQGWVFTETPEQTDFGKDGYLDFSKDGRLTGQCIALQIKGGVSFRRGGSYVIPADRRRLLGARSGVSRASRCSASCGIRPTVGFTGLT